MTEEEKIALAKEHGWNIENISHPSEAVQLAAVNNTGYAIKFIKLPSEAVQIAAVSRNGWAIQYIENPSEAVQLVAFGVEGEAITYVKNPSLSAIKLVLMNQEFIEDKLGYESIVEQLFKDNGVLMRKWLRYGDLMRNQE